MSIRDELEHSNVIVTDKSNLTDESIKELSGKYHVLMVCDVSERPDEQERRSYVEALAAAGIIAPEQVAGVMEDRSLVIIVPFLSLHVAEQTYRRISHATHFVTMYLDGDIYTAAC